MDRPSLRCLLGLLLPLTAACGSMIDSAYYATMESFGVHKREILVDRVEKGREQQATAQDQFETTFEAFKELTSFDGGELEAKYNALKREYDACKREAQEVTTRINSIENVADNLFEEWRGEIDEMSSDSLKRQSETMLRDTERDCESLIATMRTAEGQMEPVLTAFNDQVLFLKHNLNARAISSLQDTVIEIETDVEALIERMQASIQEADEFLQSMQTS